LAAAVRKAGLLSAMAILRIRSSDMRRQTRRRPGARPSGGP
jgi:hypothetical protein